MNEAPNFLGRAFRSPLLLIAAIFIVVVGAMWLAHIFPLMWRTQIAMMAIEGEAAWLTAFSAYAVKLVELWLIPILLVLAAATFIGARLIVACGKVQRNGAA